jgi:hypothetical protein
MKFQALDLRLTAIIINEDTLATARRAKRNRWLECTGIEDTSIILLFPEILSSQPFDRLLQHKTFSSCLCALGIDEVHRQVVQDRGDPSFRDVFCHMEHRRLESLVEWDGLGRAENLNVYTCHYTRLGWFGSMFLVFLVCQGIFLSVLEYFLPLLVDIMDKSYIHIPIKVSTHTGNYGTGTGMVSESKKNDSGGLPVS